METGKTGKYFKYAIGEIILVVIGILIALSINNWNEERKERILEISILNEIANNLENDLVSIDSGIEIITLYRDNSFKIYNHLEQKTHLQILCVWLIQTPMVEEDLMEQPWDMKTSRIQV